MRAILAAILLLAIFTLPVVSAGVEKTACTPNRYLAFINPNPWECATLDYGNVNDFCVRAFGAAAFERCVSFVGPPL
jgi:hypothetical protein